jgi:hypothetical protein
MRSAVDEMLSERNEPTTSIQSEQKSDLTASGGDYQMSSEHEETRDASNARNKTENMNAQDGKPGTAETKSVSGSKSESDVGTETQPTVLQPLSMRLKEGILDSVSLIDSSAKRLRKL